MLNLFSARCIFSVPRNCCNGAMSMKYLVRYAFAGVCLCAAALAQSAQQIADLAKSMPEQGQTVVSRLAELNRLPPGQWRVHNGDMSHGESVDLADSSWPTAKTTESYSTEAVWFRQWIEVPKVLRGYDLSGTRIWFQFDGGATGTRPTIIYFDGRRVALGESLEPIVLFDNAKPGDKVLVAVKLLASATPKHYYNTNMKIDFSQSRPNPDDMRGEFLAASAALPSLSNHLQADMATLGKAISQVDLKALDERSEEHTSELQSLRHLVCRLLL